MKRTRFPGRPKLTRDAERLGRLASLLAEAGSRLEDSFWESRIAELVVRLLDAGDDIALESALDKLWAASPGGYDRLVEIVEGHTECGALDHPGGPYDVLMIAAPVLAWSRFTIPAGRIPAVDLENLRAQLQGHVLARKARLGLADYLFSPDQLPRGYGNTLRFARRLWAAAADGRDAGISVQDLPDTQRFLADTRYLVGAVAVPRGAAIFRWQEDEGSRTEAVSQWQAQAAPSLHSVLRGCAFELAAPDAYYSAWRQADRLARPYSLRSAAEYVRTSLEVAATDLRAVVAPFHDQQLEEYRVGFALRGKGEVAYGVVWPLLGAEDEDSGAAKEIETLLRQFGVEDILTLEHPFPLEYCDDCGAPLFPNPEGEAVHAEMPEEAASMPTHLH